MCRGKSVHDSSRIDYSRLGQVNELTRTNA